MTIKLTSSPSRNSSITTRAGALPPELIIPIIVDSGVRFFKRHRHHDAFPGGQPISLDHNGRALLVHIAMSLVCGSKGCIGGGRNAMALHESLGKILGCFQSRGLLRGTENFQASGAENIHDALR